MDGVVGVGGRHGLGELPDDKNVQGVHGFGSIDGDGGDAVGDVAVNVGEVPSAIALVGEEGGNGPALTGGLSVGLGHATGLAYTDSVHHFERPTGPAKAHLRAAVNVLHAADVFLHDLSGDTEHHAEQSLGHGRVLLVGVRGVFRNVPLLVRFHQGPQVGSTRVARSVELLGEVIRGVEGNGWTGQVHETKRTEPDAERLAGDGVDLCCIGGTFLEQQAGFVQPWNKEAVHNKPGSVSANDDHFPQHLAVLDDLVHGLLARGFSRNHLNKSVLGGVIEEMQTDETVGSTGGFCERVDRQ